jgi:hypothetical protein
LRYLLAASLIFQIQSAGSRSDTAVRNGKYHLGPGRFDAFLNGRAGNTVAVTQYDDFFALQHTHNNAPFN